MKLETIVSRSPHMAHNGFKFKLEAGALGAGHGRVPVAGRAKRAGGGLAQRAVRDSARKMGGNLARGRMIGWGHRPTHA